MQPYKSSLIILFILLSFTELAGQKIAYSEAQTKILQSADELLKLGIAQKDSSMIAEAYYRYGKITSSTHQFLEADKWFLKAISILEKREDSFELGRLYIRLYEVEMLQQHFGESLRYLRRALKIFKNINSDRGLALTYGGFGHIYSNESAPKTILNYDSAYFYYQKVEPHYQKINDSLGIAGINFTFGGFYAKKNDKRAIFHLKKALKYFTANNRFPEMSSVLYGIVNAYLQFGDNKAAFQMIKEYEKTHIKVNNYESNKKLQKLYLNYYKTVGDWKKALKQQEIVHQLEKEDLLADHKGAVSELNIAYDTKQKEVELVKKENVIVKQSQFLFGFVVLILVALALIFLFYNLSQKNKKTSLKNEILIKEQNHRIKNNLQSISSLLSLQSNRMIDSDAKYAVEESKLRIEAMSNLHNKLYNGDELAVIELSEFIEEVVKGVLHTFGFYDIVPTYEFKNICLAADQTFPIALIINELTTNACKYAFKSNENPKLIIKSFLEKDEYIIEVVDNGNLKKDLSELNNTSEFQKSFGMRLIQTQIIQLQGSYYFFYKSGTHFTMRFKPIYNHSLKK